MYQQNLESQLVFSLSHQFNLVIFHVYRLFAHDADPDIDDPFEAPKGNVLGKTEDEQPSAGLLKLCSVTQYVEK